MASSNFLLYIVLTIKNAYPYQSIKQVLSQFSSITSTNYVQNFTRYYFFPIEEFQISKKSALIIELIYHCTL